MIEYGSDYTCYENFHMTMSRSMCEIIECMDVCIMECIFSLFISCIYLLLIPHVITPVASVAIVCTAIITSHLAALTVEPAGYGSQLGLR